jgi:hypothetical protein
MYASFESGKHMRKSNRYTANAEVHISPFPEHRAELKDISMNGCCIHSNDFIEILPNTRFMIDVAPGDFPGMKDFVLDVKSRWIRTSKGSFESGVEILVPEKSPALGQYIRYLAQQQA